MKALRTVRFVLGFFTVLALAVLLASHGLGQSDSQIGPLEKAAMAISALLFTAFLASCAPQAKRFLSDSYHAAWKGGGLLAALLAATIPLFILTDPSQQITPDRMWLYVTLPGLFALSLMLICLLPRVLGIQILVLFFLVGLSEFGAYFIGSAFETGTWETHRPTVTTEGSYYTGYFQPDSLLGYKGFPNRESRSIRYQDGQLVYDTVYSIGPEGFRITPQKATNQTAFAAFFGDSFTIGEGVGDSQTLPAQFARLAPQLKAYNYGFHGYGPQQMLALLEDDNRLNGIKERRGFAFYIYLSSHIARLKGSLQAHAWEHHTPYYRLDSNGRIVQAGNLTSGRPIFAFFYPLLVRSNILKLLKFDPLSVVTQDDVNLAAALFKAACTKFAQRFDSLGCYVVFFPGAQDEAERLKIPLGANGVGVIDLSNVWNGDNFDDYRLLGDGHASAKGYQDIAGRIIRGTSGLEAHQ